MDAAQFGMGGVPGMAGALPTAIPGAIPGAAGMGAAGLGAAGLGAGAAGIGAMGGMEGLMGLLPFLGLSERRIKTDIRAVGVLPSGLKVYSFRYIWGGPERLGVMADEVKQIIPHAVFDVGGYDAVNHAALM